MIVGVNIHKVRVVRPISAILLLCLCIPGIGFCGDATRLPLEIGFEWHLSLDADGKVIALVPLKPDHRKVIREQIEPRIRAWHFTPGKLNSSPAPTETTLFVRVVLDRTDAGDYVAKVQSADTGATYRHIVVPRYPEFLRGKAHDGWVFLRLDYDGRGEIVTAAPIQYGNEPRADPALTNAAISAIKHCSLEPESVGGAGIPGTAIAPVCFSQSPQGKICEKNIQEDNQRGPVLIDTNHLISSTSVVSLDMREHLR